MSSSNLHTPADSPASERATGRITDRLSAMAVADVGRAWWLYLVLGIAWLLYGCWC